MRWTLNQQEMVTLMGLLVRIMWPVGDGRPMEVLVYLELQERLRGTQWEANSHAKLIYTNYPDDIWA
jgi:hypothetical protein